MTDKAGVQEILSAERCIKQFHMYFWQRNPPFRFLLIPHNPGDRQKLYVLVTELKLCQNRTISNGKIGNKKGYRVSAMREIENG